MADGVWGQGAWLLAFLVVQRLVELLLARSNTRRLRAAGDVEIGAGHYPLMILLHSSWLVALVACGHDSSVNAYWLVTFVLLQGARLWVIGSLGRRWTTRVIVLPGRELAAVGPYRYVQHPNYIVVTLEIAVVPLALGLPLVALIFSIVNVAMLAYRISVENRALAWATQAKIQNTVPF
ncbi:MAG: isoprenylcysteine carboxyl methyltransferase protein [Bradyrhizobium sp.]|nr:isoprenylcysteine carboxyl methyltransferase protein [Bradyrhizobium sp.]